MALTMEGKPIEECFLCYAKTLDDNRYSKTLDGGTKENPISHWGHSAQRHRTSEENWKNPLKWDRAAERYPDECAKCSARLNAKAQKMIGNTSCPSQRNAAGDFDSSAPRCGGKILRNVRPRVFCLSLGDWLDDENVPIEWLADLLAVIHATPHLDWLLLTKRPQNWRDRIATAMVWIVGNTGEVKAIDWLQGWADGEAPANVWIGVSAGADQAAALAIPARIHFLSCEPMLRPLDTTHAAEFDMIIFGGESGNMKHENPKKRPRPCNMDWIRFGVEFCREHGIAPFVKQMGSNCRWTGVGESFAFKDRKGEDPAEWPEDLRVREFPTVEVA